mmetsp:Transcript_36588/g.71954  ORF Transcript_36588/g.71954 Transcript_36588/m.71954 type:complete len:113 (+) Transcript_36588:134-472(+)
MNKHVKIDERKKEGKGRKRHPSMSYAKVTGGATRHWLQKFSLPNAHAALFVVLSPPMACMRQLGACQGVGEETEMERVEIGASQVALCEERDEESIRSQLRIHEVFFPFLSS